LHEVGLGNPKTLTILYKKEPAAVRLYRFFLLSLSMVLHSHISQKSLSGGHGKAQQQQQQELVTTELVDEKVFDIEKRLVFLEIDCFFYVGNALKKL